MTTSEAARSEAVCSSSAIRQLATAGGFATVKPGSFVAVAASATTGVAAAPVVAASTVATSTDAGTATESTATEFNAPSKPRTSTTVTAIAECFQLPILR